MNEVRDGLRALWETLFAWLPKLLGALIVLIISYMVAKAIGKMVERALSAANMDSLVHGNRGGQLIARVVPSPSRLLGQVAFWLLYLFGISITISVMGIPALDAIVRGIYSYIPNVIAAIVIFLAAGGIAAAVDGFILKILGDTPTGKIAASITPVVIMGIAVFMILDQLNIAPTIITITYAALMGSLFLGLALAFGLGGREVAARMLEGAYNTGKVQRQQFRADMELGKKRAEHFAANVSEETTRRTSPGRSRTAGRRSTGTV